NIENAKKKLPEGVKLLEVIKANAYGHGAVEIGKFLDGKCDFFGVACVEEALELKEADIKTPVLILGYVSPSDFGLCVKEDIRIPIFRYNDAEKLSAEAVKQGKRVPFHFCVDTGMSRIGFQVTEDDADICKKIAMLDGIYAEGIFSHFATADESDLTRAIKQRERFDTFIEMLERRGVSIPIKHINNSAGIMVFDRYYDMCRMGITTYGLYPSGDVDKSLLDIRPVMSWKTHITHIKTLGAGREISYGGTYVTDRETRVATVSVGYADGYPRCLSNKGRVIIRGKYAPILGRVTMDQIIVDVSDIPEAEIEDEVVLVGSQGGASLTMEEVSEAAYSFNYELPCRISPRVHREYIYK
ncbi:MAG: alanine racemase, partial [Eubacterium sp.]|nr:alanine racemase [Eubacterium sp.]